MGTSVSSAIHVFATSDDGTRAALATAIPLARGSNARLIVDIPRVLPYALTTGDLAAPIAFVAKRYGRLLRELDGDAQIRICLCRTPGDVAGRLLAIDDAVVIGGPSGWWLPSREERLARRLRRRGHHVVFVPTATWRAR